MRNTSVNPENKLDADDLKQYIEDYVNDPHKLTGIHVPGIIEVPDFDELYSSFSTLLNKESKMTGMLQVLLQTLDLEKLSTLSRMQCISLITHITQPTATILRDIQRTYYASTECLFEYSILAATLRNHYQFDVIQKGKIERWEQSALEESDDKLSKSKYHTRVKLDELIPGMNHKHIMNSLSMLDTIWAIVVRETNQNGVFMLDPSSQDILCNTKMYEPLLYHFLSQRSYAVTKNFEFIKQMRDKMVLEKLQDIFFYSLIN